MINKKNLLKFVVVLFCIVNIKCSKKVGNNKTVQNKPILQEGEEHKEELEKDSSVITYESINVKEFFKNKTRFPVDEYGDLPISSSVDPKELSDYLKISKENVFDKQGNIYHDFILTKLNITSSSPIDTKAIMDKSVNTGWTNKDHRSGYKEWIKFAFGFKKVQGLGRNDTFGPTSILMYPGCGSDSETYKKYNRPRTIILLVESMTTPDLWPNYDEYPDHYNRVSFRIEFPDNQKYHLIIPEDPYTSNKDLSYTIYIESVYSGENENKTCIGEILFLYDLIYD
ncbi:MAG: hypothetical protein ABUK01_19400 [Leptospirales bacterium]